MRQYILIQWDGHPTPTSALGSPTPLRLFMAHDKGHAIDKVAKMGAAYDDDTQISVSDGDASWVGAVGDLYRLGGEYAWLGARPEERALLACTGGPR